MAKKRESLQTHGNLNGICFSKLSGKQQHVRNVIENQITSTLYMQFGKVTNPCPSKSIFYMDTW